MLEGPIHPDLFSSNRSRHYSSQKVASPDGQGRDLRTRSDFLSPQEHDDVQMALVHRIFHPGLDSGAAGLDVKTFGLYSSSYQLGQKNHALDWTNPVCC